MGGAYQTEIRHEMSEIAQKWPKNTQYSMFMGENVLPTWGYFCSVFLSLSIHESVSFNIYDLSVSVSIESVSLHESLSLRESVSLHVHESLCLWIWQSRQPYIFWARIISNTPPLFSADAADVIC